MINMSTVNLTFSDLARAAEIMSIPASDMVTEPKADQHKQTLTEIRDKILLAEAAAVDQAKGLGIEDYSYGLDFLEFLSDNLSELAATINEYLQYVEINRAESELDIMAAETVVSA